MFETKMTELLGIKYPIQCGTMQAITTAELVAPVASAGGLCCLPGAFYETKEALLDDVEKIRSETDKPFGINVGLFPSMQETRSAVRTKWTNLPSSFHRTCTITG